VERVAPPKLRDLTPHTNPTTAPVAVDPAHRAPEIRDSSRVARELERTVVALVRKIYGGQLIDTPAWLLRAGQAECRAAWPLIQNIYRELEGGELPAVMPPRERRVLDAVLQRPGESPRILEVDETQHFNAHRAATLRAYPDHVPTAFPRELWIERCEQKRQREGGGFARPCPPLFDGSGGRHRQRAFRDALADLVPLEHGWLPTLRIADFEIRAWLHTPDAAQRIAALLHTRL
jgi:hypothetical protein